MTDRPEEKGSFMFMVPEKDREISSEKIRRFVDALPKKFKEPRGVPVDKARATADALGLARFAGDDWIPIVYEKTDGTTVAVGMAAPELAAELAALRAEPESGGATSS